MKKILITLILGLFLVSFVSAGMSFSIQPHSVYNFGDKVNTTQMESSMRLFRLILSVEMEKFKFTKNFYLLVRIFKRM